MGTDSAQVTIKGRDKTGDLVDCSAVYPGGQWRLSTLQQIAQDLCKPFGIAVRWAVSDPEAAKPFTSFTIERSESVADVLSWAERHRGVLVTSNADGDLVFTQAANTPTDTLRLGENLLSTEYTEDWRDRHSQYLFKGHGGGGGHAGDANTNELRAALKGESDDPAIVRYRPKVILADSKLTPAIARARAMRESRRALAQSERFTAVVKGWRRESGELWQTNRLTRVIAPRLSMISRDQATVLLVEDRRHRPTGLPAGDSGLYHYEGHRLRLTRDSRCIITCKTLEVVVEQEAVFNTPTARFTDDVVIEKNLTVKQNMTVAGDAESQGAFSAPAVSGAVSPGRRHTLGLRALGARGPGRHPQLVSAHLEWGGHSGRDLRDGTSPGYLPRPGRYCAGYRLSRAPPGPGHRRVGRPTGGADGDGVCAGSKKGRYHAAYRPQYPG